MKCQNCGNSIPDDSEFCQFCGERVEIDSTFRCPSCNNPLPADSEFCQFCGKELKKPQKAVSKIPSKKKFSKSLIAIIAISLIAVGLAGLNFWQYNKVSEIQEELEKVSADLKIAKNYSETLKKQYSTLKSNNDKLESNLDFYQTYVVFVDDDTRYYHWSHNCSRFDSSYFWAYNVENAKQQGYVECPDCSSILSRWMSKYN